MRLLKAHRTTARRRLSTEQCRWRVRSVFLARLVKQASAVSCGEGSRRCAPGLLLAGETGGLLIELGGAVLELLRQSTKLCLSALDLIGLGCRITGGIAAQQGIEHRRIQRGS